MPLRLTLVCHAATGATRTLAFADDAPLDAAARQGIPALAGGFRRVDQAWSSPSPAARETAAALGLDAAPESAIADLDMGGWRGRTMQEVVAEAPGAFAAWMSDPHAAPHGGETLSALLGRVGGWLDHLAAEENAGAPAPPTTSLRKLVAVSHASVLRAALLHALGAPAAGFWRIDIPPLARLVLKVRVGHWTLDTLDRLAADRLADQPSRRAITLAV